MDDLPNDPVALVHQENPAIGSRAEAQVDADGGLQALLGRFAGLGATQDFHHGL